jgi:hypothetical protein
MVNTHTGERFILELQDQMLMDLKTAEELARGATVNGLPAVTDDSLFEFPRVAERGQTPVAIYAVVPANQKSVTNQIAIELKRGSRPMVFNNNEALVQWLNGQGGDVMNDTSTRAILAKVKQQILELETTVSKLESSIQ